MTASALFEPLSVRGAILSNRLVMSPMTRMFSPGGVPGADVADYYRRRAEGGTGLIVTEGIGLDHPGAIDADAIPVLHGTKAIDGWSAVVRAVHGAGGTIFPQLWHMGPMRKSGISRHPDAEPMRPSGLGGSSGGHAVWGLEADQLQALAAPTRPMDENDIEEVIAAYAGAARAASAIGFDGVAIHAAHGYLPDAFLWGETNRRADRWGGDVAGRTRFVVELVRAIRAEIGDLLPIMLRFSQWKQQDYGARLAETPAELARILEPLADAGVDIFDASTRRFDTAEFAGSSLNLAAGRSASPGSRR